MIASAVETLGYGLADQRGADIDKLAACSLVKITGNLLESIGGGNVGIVAADDGNTLNCRIVVVIDREIAEIDILAACSLVEVLRKFDIARRRWRVLAIDNCDFVDTLLVFALRIERTLVIAEVDKISPSTGIEIVRNLGVSLGRFDGRAVASNNNHFVDVIGIELIEGGLSRSPDGVEVSFEVLALLLGLCAWLQGLRCVLI